MKLLALLLVAVTTCGFAQDTIYKSDLVPSHLDTIQADTPPKDGYDAFQLNLETMLNGADTVGSRYLLSIKNIGFIVNMNGAIGSAWVIYDRRPINFEIIKQLKLTPWQAAIQDGVYVTSRQYLNLKVRLTKAALKRHASWSRRLRKD